jgi:predicted phosphodiesterase
MIYVTGDTHGDLERFKHSMFRKISKRDTLIICGDFGFIWDGSKREKRILKWLGKRRYEVLFVDGVHENFDELEKYEIQRWNGGDTRVISGKLRQLMRGNVFDIDGKRILAFGGGDRDEAVQGESGKCAPTPEDFERAMAALEKHDSKIDYIVSYEPPATISEFLALGNNASDTLCQGISDTLNYYLDKINEKAKYERWFFGRHHINKIIPKRHFALFDDVISVESEPKFKK